MTTELLQDALDSLYPKIGAYVLATKYTDGDPGDAWALGFFDGITSGGRYLVIDSKGNQCRHTGYRSIHVVSAEVGAWMWASRAVLEASPPGSVNLWSMLGLSPRSVAKTVGASIPVPINQPKRLAMSAADILK